MKSKWKGSLPLIVCLITVIAPLIIMLTSSEGIETSQSLCPLKMLTGLPCPSCGITKSIIFLYQGELSKSIYYHLLGIPLIITCLIYLTIYIVKRVAGTQLKDRFRWSDRYTYLIVTFVMIYYLIRLSYYIYTYTISEMIEETLWIELF